MKQEAYLTFRAGSIETNVLVHWRGLLATQNDKSAETHAGAIEINIPKPSTGDRANLRRCADVFTVMLQPAYHALRRTLEQIGRTGRSDALPVMVGALAHVREDIRNAPFAAQMAMPKAQGGAPRLSHLRFRRFLKYDGLDELYLPLIRVIRLLDGNVNVPSMIESIYNWQAPMYLRKVSTKQQWAFEYFDAIQKSA